MAKTWFRSHRSSFPSTHPVTALLALLLFFSGSALLAQEEGAGAQSAGPQDDADDRHGDARDEPAARSGEGTASATDEALERRQEDRERDSSRDRDPALAAEASSAGPAAGGGGENALPTESSAFRNAYATLARAEAAGDPDGLDPVKELFEREIDAGRNLARAHNGLGRYYLQQHEHVITVLESIQKLFNWDHVTQARKHFRLATEADPAYAEAWYNWAIAGRKAKDEDALREAERALRKVVELDSGYRDAYRLLAVTLRDLGDYAGSERVLAEWRTKAGFSLALANLEQAYLQMGVANNTAQGARLYREGLAAARDTAELGAYFDDVKLILTDDEREAFQKLDLERRRTWLAAFWQRAADQALVTIDERLAEHYRRLAHVERTYALTIPQRRHYSAITAYRPKEQSGFDDRGVVYLRHGEPDDVARFTGPNVQRNESWLYHREDGDLVFHFVSDEDTEDFKLVTSLVSALNRGNTSLAQGRNTGENAGELFQSRARLDPLYNRLAFQFDPMLLREEEEQVARDVKVGVSTASYVPPSPDSLPFYAYAAPFRARDGSPELEVYVGVPTADLELAAGGAGGTRLAYTAQMVLSDDEADAEDEAAARAADSVAVEVPNALPRDRGVLIPNVLRATVPEEGEYGYRIRVRDLLSGKTGTLKGEIKIDDLRGFSASGLVLASRVERAPGGGKFTRGDLKVVPLPSLSFRPGQPVVVYYEVYDLSPGDDGRVRYRTEYRIRTREKKRNIAVKLLGSLGNLVGTRNERAEEVGLSVDGEVAPAERIQEYITLDLNESEPGPYEIVVGIEDLVTGRKLERRAPFVLVG